MFLSMPLGDSFLRASEKLSGGTALIFADIGKGLKENRDSLPADIIKDAVERNISGTFMKPEDAEDLISLGKTIGEMDSEHQRASIDMTISAIEDRIRAVREKSGKNEKMYSSIFVLVGILIAVVLI